MNLLNIKPNWSRWDEVKQRVTNFFIFTELAWRALFTDSYTFAMVLITQMTKESLESGVIRFKVVKPPTADDYDYDADEESPTSAMDTLKNIAANPRENKPRLH